MARTAAAPVAVAVSAAGTLVGSSEALTVAVGPLVAEARSRPPAQVAVAEAGIWAAPTAAVRVVAAATGAGLKAAAGRAPARQAGEAAAARAQA